MEAKSAPARVAKPRRGALKKPVGLRKIPLRANNSGNTRP